MKSAFLYLHINGDSATTEDFEKIQRLRGAAEDAGISIKGLHLAPAGHVNFWQQAKAGLRDGTVDFLFVWQSKENVIGIIDRADLKKIDALECDDPFDIPRRTSFTKQESLEYSILCAMADESLPAAPTADQVMRLFSVTAEEAQSALKGI
ncbi:hypothetical protein [Streptomyces sp. 5-10]|uniref:hypothetical protein n=1 Tax=Streptomyces sp. 5-10 TaxID=878925 RepID=UPI00168BDAE5|nr:hypothetical protein [Streptomyces sp. 5-10]MBD3004709.1 hypothetical protein [Streptomyces sp. 5-10]